MRKNIINFWIWSEENGNMSETTLGMNGIRDEMTGILTAYGNISFSFLKNRKEEGMGVCIYMYINIIIIIIINNNNK